MCSTGEDRLYRWILIGFFGIVLSLQLCGADDQTLTKGEEAKNDLERAEGYRMQKKYRKQ